MRVFVVIPAYNEDAHIRQTITQVAAAGSYDIVVVDDGSEDRTFDYARQGVTALRHPANRGMGAALVTGMTYALEHDADIIVHFDADGQHDARDIAVVIGPLLEDCADIVLGSRYLKANKLPWTKRYLSHKPALWMKNTTTGLRLTDVHSGFRALNRHAAEAIHITQDRMAHASEIVSEIARQQLRYFGRVYDWSNHHSGPACQPWSHSHHGGRPTILQLLGSTLSAGFINITYAHEKNHRSHNGVRALLARLRACGVQRCDA